MSLSREYQEQFKWRGWPRIFDRLPVQGGRTVLDLGCGIGDQAAELAARGARVIGVDLNEELLDVARSRRLADAEFRSADLRALPDLGPPAEGIWSSFSAAYFPDLAPVLAGWKQHLRPGGWIAVTEVDDLFGHQPLGPRARSALETYAAESLAAGRYDFHMGRKLEAHLERAGFTVSEVLTLEDRELAFTGPAEPAVVEAWRSRFERMKLLRDSCGPAFEEVREEFLACLALPGHRSTARVCCVLAKG